LLLLDPLNAYEDHEDHMVNRVAQAVDPLRGIGLDQVGSGARGAAPAASRTLAARGSGA
jgi:hypothetical protein